MAKDERLLVVSCIPCNKRVEVVEEDGVRMLLEFSQLICKDCLGAANVDVIEK